MQTDIHPTLKLIPLVQEAEEILRSCVHCGFCNAVCPTYQLLGDELDSPRGRIYQIKNLLKNNEISFEANVHLDRCLTCRSCETTCPSGVKYGRLIDIARGLIDLKPKFPAQIIPRFKSLLLRNVVPYKDRFSFLLRIAQFFIPVLPRVLSKQIPPKQLVINYPAPTTSLDRGSVLLLGGCVQNVSTPNVNNSIEFILSRLGIKAISLEKEGCCGALEYHLCAQKDGIEKMITLVERLHDNLERVDYIISSASGCGVTLKEYPEVLQNEPDISESILNKARAVSGRVLDIGEYLSAYTKEISDLSHQSLSLLADPIKLAIHTPCSLQHGQKLPDLIGPFFQSDHIDILSSVDSHLCCGSAGAYSIMQPEISRSLTERKLKALNEHGPDLILTANIGCQLTLEASATVAVKHWVEFLAQLLNQKET
ncbi:MAG: glycolate oxidase iron-sulfur subunit [Candidatus Azotimanducaceae bacterium]|jgi:glycolate oxidase iron-sulfur subunit